MSKVYIKQEFKSKNIELSRHINEHFVCAHDDLREYTCANCDFATHLSVLLRKHNHYSNELSLKLPREYICRQCETFHTYSKLVYLKHSYEKCKSLGPFKARSEPDLTQHSNKVHTSASNWLSCDLCPYTAKSRTVLKRHCTLKHIKPTKSSPKRFKCGQCNFETPWSWNLKKHLKLQHSKTCVWFKCELCQFKTTRSFTLKSHQKVHLPEDEIQWFYCEHCSHRAKTNYQINRHILSLHTDPRLIDWHRCHVCDFKTKQNGHLKAHVRAKHTSRDRLEHFKCDFCDYKTIDKFVLKKHTRFIHFKTRRQRKAASRDEKAEEKKFTCEQCPFRTKTKPRLVSHVISYHTAAKDIEWFECGQCQYKSKTKRHLLRHQKWQHVDVDQIRWHQCQFCEHRTKQKTHLKAHVKAKHTDKKDLRMFVCDQCTYSTAFVDTLRRHVRARHSK